MRCASVVILLSLFASSLCGAGYPAPVEHDFLIRDFHFASGETLPEVRIHYVTIGAPVRDEKGSVRNAVLILHGTGGSSQQFLNEHFGGVLFAPGGVLDASRYFIVIPDNVGHGRSSKPSNGLHARFPRYDYDDMVDAQHRLLVDGLGITHLFLVAGTSMGGMQTWMWGERYPDMMEALLPLASAPTQIAGRNRIWRKMLIDEIRSDPDWLDGEYKQQPRGLASAVRILLLAGSAPLQWQKAAGTRNAADKWLADQLQSRLAGLDANDLLYAIDSSRNYDPSGHLDRITAPLLAINSADDFINPPELGIVEELMKKVARGRYILLPITSETHGHGSHTWAAVWQQHVREFLAPLGTH